MKGRAHKARRASVENLQAGLTRTTTKDLLDYSEAMGEGEKVLAKKSPKARPRRASVSLSTEQMGIVNAKTEAADAVKKKKEARSSGRRASVTAMDFKQAKGAAEAG
jgi:hypothetical protein